MASNFLVWRPGTMKDGVCKLNTLTGVDDTFEIDDGISRSAGWPPYASAPMDPDFPKDIGLADSLYGATFLVISLKAKSFLDQATVTGTEFLPLKIINHKGRLASSDYFVVNPLQKIDCVNHDASGVEFDPLDEGMIESCTGLVLCEDAIPADTKLFRVASWSGLILMRRELAGSLQTAGLTGMNFIEPSEYTGLF